MCWKKNRITVYRQKKTMRKFASIILAVLFLLTTANSYAQGIYTDWQAKPVAHVVRAMYKNESAVILDEQRVHEFSKDEKNDLWIHIYTRRLMKLNDEKGVEMYNKIYVFVPPGAEVIEIKARTMQPDGRVVNLPAEKIFDVEEEGKHYKKFALEGIEKGSEIEYFVHQKKQLSTFGVEVFRSANTPFEKASFTLIVPAYLFFNVKSYNGFKVTPDTVIDNKRKY